MSTVLKLTSASIKMFVRNKQALFFTLFTPIIIMAIFGLIGFDHTPKINVGLVAHNPNGPTKEFIGQIKNISAFSVTEGNEDEQAQALAQGDRVVVFSIPDNLFPDSQASTSQTVTAIMNSGQRQNAGVAISVVSQILDKSALRLANAPEIFKMETREVNSRDLKYIDFLLPGIVALAVMQMSVFSVAFVFADYKEKGILKRILATPLRPYQFVSANVITRLFISVAQAAILIAIGVLAFNAHVVGSYLLILLIVLLGAIMFLGLGFTISGFSNTVESVPAIANLVVFPMLFLGGTFFPIDTMPDWLQKIANVLPLTYFSTALRDVMTQDAGLGDIQKNLLFMAGWSVILVLAANFTFGFEEKKV